MPIQTYGFIGLGNMGYGMALNVRAKMPQSCKLIVCDVNTQQRDKFISEAGGLVEAAETPKEVAEKCVCIGLDWPRLFDSVYPLANENQLGCHHHKPPERRRSEESVYRFEQRTAGSFWRRREENLLPGDVHD